ncbi:MAG: putative sulfate exporter family transporter [Bacillota bacterium]
MFCMQQKSALTASCNVRDGSGAKRAAKVCAFSAVRRLGPGFLLTLGISIVTRTVAPASSPLSDVVIAVIIGMVLNNTLRLPLTVQPGIKLCTKSLLKLGIILLGVGLSLHDVARVGTGSFWVVLSCIVTALAITQYLGSRFRLPARLTTLIGVGTAICGATAIVATAPVIEAEGQEVSFAIAAITVFGVLAIFTYPVAGRWMGLSQSALGTWAGAAIHETSQVVAASFAYGEKAGEVATIVKLTRTAFLPFVMLAMAAVYGSFLDFWPLWRLTHSESCPVRPWDS